MKAIFLDVDGVLIHDGYLNGSTNHVDEEKIKLLKKIVDQTGAKIVLSSSWRKYYNKQVPFKTNPYELFEQLLNKEGLNIYDRTPTINTKGVKKIDKETGLQIIDMVKEPHGSRAAEIHKWIEEHDDLESFVIIEDQYDSYDYFGYDENLITTTKEYGLTDENVEDAITILNRSKVKRR